MAANKTLFCTKPGYPIRLLLVFIFLACANGAFCFAGTSIFEPVTRLSPADRVSAATVIYKRNFRKAPPAVAMAQLDALRVIAQELKDRSLECAVFDMRADYYSVNKGFNKLSTDYYQQAIDFAITNNLTFEKGLYLYKMGTYYNVFMRNGSAVQYFLKAEEIFSQVGYNNIPEINSYLAQIASFYYGLGDYENAKQHLEAALRYCTKNNRDKINILNTLGLIYRNYREFPPAVVRFKQALGVAVAIKDTIWIGIINGNIGSVYFLQGQYQKALPYIQADYTTSVKYGEPVNGALAMLRLAKINIDSKNLKEANEQLNQVLILIKGTKEDILGILADESDLRSQLYELQGLPAQALYYRKIYEADKDSISKRNNLAAVERVKLRWETDKRLTQLNKMRADERILSVEINAGVAVVLLLIVISVLVYNKQRLENNKNKDLMIAEKRIVDEELKNAGAALHLFTESLRQKNVLIEKFKQEMSRMNMRSVTNTDATHLEKLLEAHIMTEENWNDFKKLFSKVYPGFFVNLNKMYPNLSTADTRILTLIRLGLNNPEMSNMLGITISGIKKAKQRLRKKIDFDIVATI